MGIAFRDFDRKIKEKLFGGAPDVGPLQDAVDQANQWISANKVEVINVESLMEVTSDRYTTWTVFGGVRVWYRA